MGSAAHPKAQDKKQCADKDLREMKISFNLAVICKSEKDRRTYAIDRTLANDTRKVLGGDIRNVDCGKCKEKGSWLQRGGRRTASRSISSASPLRRRRIIICRLFCANNGQQTGMPTPSPPADNAQFGPRAR
jgi:hypothetical protein